MPNVWCGEHRLTKENWFNASAFRNTGLCMAPDGYIAYVDDLSVLMPGWLSAVREAMAGGYVVCGAYKKVKDLQVENGVVKSYTEFPAGIDGRWQYATGDPCPAESGWLFGCSCAMPVEALLTINGWPDGLCGGLGFEDCCTGIVLTNAGYKMMYDRRMLTLESEEHHHIEPALRREDWHFVDGKPVMGGDGSTDKSHSALNIAMGSKRFPNHFDIRELRQKILAGEPFPIFQVPEHEWFSKTPIKDL
jgi:glycosyltransferase involved in cell wall biosynthesis